MSRLSLLRAMAGVAVCVVGPLCAGQSPQPPKPPVDAQPVVVPTLSPPREDAAQSQGSRPEGNARAASKTHARWQARLLALSPRDPEGYLLLGEEVLDDIQTPQDRRLAIELLVLAFDLSRVNDAASPVATSACLALADVATTRRERARLRSLAGSLLPKRASGLSAPAMLHAESPRYLAATAMGLVRAGYGSHARNILRRHDVALTLQSVDGLMQRLGVPGGADTVAREARRWPCLECANRRVLPTRNNQFRVCATCRGTPGPRLTRVQLLAYLRAEMWLIRDPVQPWSLQEQVDDGLPAELVDPAMVARMFRVDGKKAYWRAGFWRTNADGTDTFELAPVPALPPMPALSAPDEQIAPDQEVVPASPGVPTQQPMPLPPGINPGLSPGLNPAVPPGLPSLPVPGRPDPNDPNRNPSEDPLPTEPK